jgi:hypothetical protein
LILGDRLDQLIAFIAEVSCLACSYIAKVFADIFVGKIANAAHQKGRKSKRGHFTTIRQN